MSDYVSVTATVTRPWGEVSTHWLGTLEAWAVAGGIDPRWKRDRRAMVLMDCGHYPEPCDGWRVAFSWEVIDDD